MFQFRLVGQESVNGRNCYVIAATPKTGYQPSNRETKVLTGMRGTMWFDTSQFQWVKVYAEVFRPVAFGVFIADVKPGTEIHPGGRSRKRKSVAAISLLNLGKGQRPCTCGRGISATMRPIAITGT
jgi:hypothetical protein